MVNLTGLLTFKALRDNLMKKISVRRFVCCLAPPHKTVIVQQLQRTSHRLLTHAELSAQLLMGEDAEYPFFLLVVESASFRIADQVVIAQPDSIIQCADHCARRQIIILEYSSWKGNEHVFLCHDGDGVIIMREVIS